MICADGTGFNGSLILYYYCLWGLSFMSFSSPFPEILDRLESICLQSRKFVLILSQRRSLLSNDTFFLALTSLSLWQHPLLWDVRPPCHAHRQTPLPLFLFHRASFIVQFSGIAGRGSRHRSTSTLTQLLFSRSCQHPLRLCVYRLGHL